MTACHDTDNLLELCTVFIVGIVVVVMILLLRMVGIEPRTFQMLGLYTNHYATRVTIWELTLLRCLAVNGQCPT